MGYHKLEKEKVVYVDIDDTLILWEPEKWEHKEEEIIWIEDYNRKFPFLPHKKNLEFLQRLKLQGYGVVVWSAAGATWAETVVNQLGIQDLPDMIISKPEFCIDDFLEAKQIIKRIIWIDPNDGTFNRSV